MNIISINLCQLESFHIKNLSSGNTDKSLKYLNIHFIVMQFKSPMYNIKCWHDMKQMIQHRPVESFRLTSWLTKRDQRSTAECPKSWRKKLQLSRNSYLWVFVGLVLNFRQTCTGMYIDMCNQPGGLRVWPSQHSLNKFT